MSSATCGKIQNFGFYGPKCVCFVTYLADFGSFWSITLNFVIILAENFLKGSPKCLLTCISSGVHGKIGIFV